MQAEEHRYVFGPKEKCDAILVSNEGWVFHVHQVVLALHSECFQDLDWEEPVHLAFSTSACHIFLNWIYSVDELTCPPIDHLTWMEIWSMSVQYNIRKSIKFCEKHVVRLLALSQNFCVLRIANLAAQFGSASVLLFLSERLADVYLTPAQLAELSDAFKKYHTLRTLPDASVDDTPAIQQELQSGYQEVRLGDDCDMQIVTSDSIIIHVNHARMQNHCTLPKSAQLHLDYSYPVCELFINACHTGEVKCDAHRICDLWRMACEFRYDKLLWTLEEYLLQQPVWKSRVVDIVNCAIQYNRSKIIDVMYTKAHVQQHHWSQLCQPFKDNLILKAFRVRPPLDVKVFEARDRDGHWWHASGEPGQNKGVHFLGWDSRFDETVEWDCVAPLHTRKIALQLNVFFKDMLETRIRLHN